MSQTNTKTQINSNEKSGHWILVIMGILFCLISTPVILAIPEEISKGNYGIFIALIFPLAGLGMLYGSWKMRQKFLFFGPTPLTPSPAIGQVGGHVGGRINLAQAWEKRDLDISLSCINTYTSGTGKNATTHRSILWQEYDKPLDRPNDSGAGSTLEFCFDVPAGERTNDTYNGRGSIHWEVSIEGLIKQTEFKRSWKIPVEVGTQTSNIVIPNAHKEASHSAKRQQAEASIDQQIKTEKTATGLDITSDQGRNKSMSWFLVLFGAIFASVGCFLFFQAFQGEAILWIMAPIFFAIGAGILAFGIFLVGRKLECKIIGDQVYTRRSLFGRILYTRQGKLTSPEQLILKSTMSSTTNGKHTEYMGVFAKIDINGPNGSVKKEIKLVEGIEGNAAGEAMKRKLADALLENNNDLKGELEAF
ncbi:MAG: uncharacterized membrane protein HdeD (DUF308 family) [Oleispira sp.]|jgi:uncharacterized membrane protein HdeD (DUF308 family)